MSNKKIGEQRLIEFRAVENDSEEMILEGYAITYDCPASHEIGSGKTFTEVIKRGALDATDISDVPMRYNHNNSWMIIARTRNNSLELIKDERGLKIRATLIDTTSNRDIYKSVQAGLIDKMSFSFKVADKGDTWTYGDTGAERSVTNILRIFDVSLVDVPFYDTTNVYARTAELLENNEQKLENFTVRKKRAAAKLRLKIKEENK